MRHTIISLILFLGIPTFAFAQDIEDEYKAFLEQRANEMIEFQNQRDKEFSDFLKENWEVFTSVAGVEKAMPGPDKPIVYKKPPAKPETQPKEDVRPEKKDKTRPESHKKDRPIGSKKPEKKPLEKPKPKPIDRPKKKDEAKPIDKPVKEKPIVLPPKKEKPKEKPTWQQPSRENQSGNVDFYGGRYMVSLPSSKVYLSGINEDNIAEAWTNLAKTNYKTIVDDCLRLKKDLNLDDWGYVLLTKSVAKQMSKRQTPDEIVFAQFFLLAQSNYKVKVARADGQLSLLVASNHLMYRTTYVEIGAEKYFVIPYNLQKNVSTIYTFRKNFADATHKLDMTVGSVPTLSQNLVDRRFESSGMPYDPYFISAKVNVNLMDYYNDFPQFDMDTYMNTGISPELENFVLPQFEEYLRGKTLKESASILLEIIQSSFPYATDREQFGYEKPYFVDECFFYPKNDCEDRAVLYGYLVKKLLNLDVILLQYPNHIATAVAFPEEMKGDMVMHRGRKYLICDPTYINAPIGACMPQFKMKTPSVFVYK